MFGRTIGSLIVSLPLLVLAAMPARAMDAAAPAPAADAVPATEVAPALPAAPPAPAAAPPAVDPNLVVNEAQEDWSVRCFRVESPAPCDVLQIGTSSETQQRVLLISIAYVPSRDAYAMQIIVPLGVELSQGLTLAAGEASLTSLRFTRCERDGCYVETGLPQPTIDALSAMAEGTTITITAFNEDETIELPFSVSGFAAAMARMREEAEARAVEPPAPQ
jgi:invasion protein IalB